ncbi:glycosyl hydrolase [Olivibacter sp. CPCC 100613]|uniref:glycosyl hydrolase n=1 Tax=Olivibacter sp. CPCC 100613 TaxID=3079931 RepID=UPI002FFBFAB0
MSYWHLNLFRAIGLLSTCFLFWKCASPPKDQSFASLEQAFQQAPDSIQTSVYWYWISDNISKEGVIKDLEAMKAVGINRAFIGNIGLADIPYGKVKLFSDQWWEITHAALKKASELGIEIGLFNSPGWSQSGGPWVKPEQAMRYLAATETLIAGGRQVIAKLPKTVDDFQDVRLIAFPAPKGYGQSIADVSPTLTAKPSLQHLQRVIDREPQTAVKLPAGESAEITFTTAEDYTLSSLTITPDTYHMTCHVQLQVAVDTGYREIKSFKVDRSNSELNVGFEPYAPVVVSFAPVSGKKFRLLFTEISADAAIAEIALSPAPRVERFKEKVLAKMHPTPLPYWHDYQWAVQEPIVDEALLTKANTVIDITDKMGPDDTLRWEAPPGNWIVLRTGMVPTGVKNSPASPEGTGLEIDKMNHQHVIQHFDAFLGEIMRRIPAEDRKTWKVAVQDSYEMGGQNWTDDFIEKFKKQYGYDPKPYIPVMYGHVIESQDVSDRFLWDLRRFVADNVAYEYVGGLRDISHKHGLNIWLENYGHWGFPGEFLQYGGQSDEIGGEFWSEGDLGNIENRAASSAAHIYGKTKVSAESFTAAGNTFGRYPALMKQRGDRFFAEGINNSLLHVYIHQAYEDKKPGVNAWFGNEFNRFNTWYPDMDLFVQYLKRCNLMLQQGKYVADVAYFIGEDAPKMTGVQDPILPSGYSFDYINGEVIRNRMKVEDGRLVLPDGMSYRLLVLPKLETMRPELLEKIEQLVKAGGVVLGPKPKRSPSLQHGKEADKKVEQLANTLWKGIDGKQVKTHAYGKGMVMDGLGLEEALGNLNIIPDVKLGDQDTALFLHRHLEGGDIYFVSNQTAKKTLIQPRFRVSGKIPELWNAINGTQRELPEFTQDAQTTTVPLSLEAYESAFIIFRKAGHAKEKNDRLNFPLPMKTDTVRQSWTVRFDTTAQGPDKPVVFQALTDWSKNPDERIRHYSGAAKYQTTINVQKPKEEERVYLNMGSVIALAKVKINDKELGGVWTPPYKVDITSALQDGENQVEIKVVNTWVNRLIGDLGLPEDKRKTWLYVNPYKKDSPLHPAGLFGPVVIETYPYW